MELEVDKITNYLINQVNEDLVNKTTLLLNSIFEPSKTDIAQALTDHLVGNCSLILFYDNIFIESIKQELLIKVISYL
jgi:hypothetical protein